MKNLILFVTISIAAILLLTGCYILLDKWVYYESHQTVCVFDNAGNLITEQKFMYTDTFMVYTSDHGYGRVVFNVVKLTLPEGE